MNPEYEDTPCATLKYKKTQAQSSLHFCDNFATQI